jgi:phage protein D
VGYIKRPAWEIKIDNKIISDALNRAVQSIAFDDEAGIDSDAITIVFTGDLPHIEAGRKIALKLGYKGEELTSAGLFAVESSTWTREALSVTATALNFAGAMKTKRAQTYEGVTIADIVAQISVRAEVSATPLCDFGDTRVNYLAQNDESDMHFLSRLSKEYDAVFSVKSDRIIFLKRGGEGQKQTERLPTYEINAKLVSELTIKQKARPKYAAVQAIWRAQQEQETQSVLVGEGEPIFKLAFAFPDAATAKLRAEAKLRALRRDCVEGGFSCEGTMFRAGGIIALKNAGENNTDYEIKKVSHHIDKSGWITSVELGGA